MARDPHYQEFLMRRGRVRQIAQATGLSRQAISAWRRIPAERAIEIADKLDYALWELRPDLWPPPQRVPESEGAAE